MNEAILTGDLGLARDIDNAWEDGYAAYEAGDTLGENPFEYHTACYDAWEAGWDEAKADEDERDAPAPAPTVTEFKIPARGGFPVCEEYRKARAADDMLLHIVARVVRWGLDILTLILTDEGDWYMEVGVAGIPADEDDPYFFQWERGEVLLHEAGEAYELAVHLTA